MMNIILIIDVFYTRDICPKLQSQSRLDCNRVILMRLSSCMDLICICSNAIARCVCVCVCVWLCGRGCFLSGSVCGVLGKKFSIAFHRPLSELFLNSLDWTNFSCHTFSIRASKRICHLLWLEREWTAALFCSSAQRTSHCHFYPWQPVDVDTTYVRIIFILYIMVTGCSNTYYMSMFSSWTSQSPLSQHHHVLLNLK